MRKVNSEDKRKGFVFYWGYYDAMQKRIPPRNSS